MLAAPQSKQATTVTCAPKDVVRNFMFAGLNRG